MHRAGLGSGLLVLVVVLAGCSGVPFTDPPPQEEPAPVKLVNNASQTETFTVAVVDVGANLTVSMADGEIFNKQVGQGSSTYKTTSDVQMANISFPDSARVHGQYTIDPGEEKLVHIENMTPDKAIVVLVFDESEGTYRAIHSVSCGEAILGMKVLTQAEGEDETVGVHQCG